MHRFARARRGDPGSYLDMVVVSVNIPCLRLPPYDFAHDGMELSETLPSYRGFSVELNQFRGPNALGPQGP